jgi:RNA polymerase sigma-70 factor (ECF subfamily)
LFVGSCFWSTGSLASQLDCGMEIYNSMDELELISAAKNGDLQAFNRLVVEYQDMVFRQARYWVNDEETAADITQDTFIKAYQSLKGFKGGSFRAWLLRTATHAAIDELRRRQRRPTLSIDYEDDDGMDQEFSGWMADPEPLPEEIVERNQLQQAVQFILEQVKPVYRAAVVLVDLQGLDYEEASEVLGIPVGTLKSRLARGRMMMRALFEKSRVSFENFGDDTELEDDWALISPSLR